MKQHFTKATLLLLLTLMASATAWADPDLIIRSAADWNTFASSGNTYQGQTVMLAADITVTTMADNFKGTFDGCGHTLTINYTTSGQSCAPFRHTENATFRNLKVAGSINTGNRFAGGFVAISYGACTLENCQSSITIIPQQKATARMAVL